MPIYEYRCTKCGEVTEALQKLTDPPLRRCPHCSGKLDKLISRTSFQLKGGGWYAQGYGTAPAKDDAAGAKAKDKSDGAEPKAKGSGKKKKDPAGSGSGGRNQAA